MNHSAKVGYVVKVFPRLSETFILNEILELERQGLEVEILSLKPPMEPRFHGELARLRAQITYLPGVGSTAWRNLRTEFQSMSVSPLSAGTALLHCLQSPDSVDLKDFLQALALSAAAKRRGIHHLHAHFASGATRIAMLAHLLLGLSFSFTAHAKDIYHQDRDPGLLTDALKHASFAVTVTDYNVSRLRKLAPFAHRKIHRIYNGVRLEDYLHPRVSRGDPPLIMAVGRLVEKKGFCYLVEACRQLKKSGRHFHCQIVGTGDQETDLRDRIQALDLADTISLVGPQSHDRVMEMIAQSAVMVLPCVVAEDGNRDALPTVLLESMALGKPVVSTDLPGVTEIVDHEETGLLVRQRDGTALAQALGRMLSDAGLRRACGEAGRSKAERCFSLSRNVSELMTCFLECLDQPLVAAAGGRTH